MKTKDFLKKHSACTEGAKWTLSISEEMDAVWDAMVEQGEHDLLIWTATRPGVFPDSSLRKLACRFIRETPLSDGRKVWDLLTDERSRKAVEVAELYDDGNATDGELQAAYDAAYAAVADAVYDVARDNASYAAYAAYAAATYAAREAARGAVYAAFASRDAARAAAYAAKAAQVQIIAEMGNPFKERTTQWMI